MRTSRDKLPGDALALSLQKVWEVIRDQKDLNLPAHKVRHWDSSGSYGRITALTAPGCPGSVSALMARMAGIEDACLDTCQHYRTYPAGTRKSDDWMINCKREHIKCWHRSWWQTSGAQKSWRISSGALKKTRRGWACVRKATLGLSPILVAEQAHCWTLASQVSHSPGKRCRDLLHVGHITFMFVHDATHHRTGVQECLAGC